MTDKPKEESCNKNERLRDLLVVEYKEGKNDLRIHAQLIWVVISVFYATVGLLYMGYSGTITSSNHWFSIIIAIFGYLFSIIITSLILAERRQWSIAIEKTIRVKNMLKKECSDDSKKWIDDAKNILDKDEDKFFNKIDDKGMLHVLRGYRVEWKSVFLYQLLIQFMVIAIWSYFICYATLIPFNLELSIHSLWLYGLVISSLILISVFFILLVMRRQNEDTALSFSQRLKAGWCKEQLMKHYDISEGQYNELLDCVDRLKELDQNKGVQK